MTLQLTYGEIKELADSKVDNFSLWYVNNSKIHILVKVKKFLMTHKINVDVFVREVKNNMTEILIGWQTLH